MTFGDCYTHKTVLYTNTAGYISVLNVVRKQVYVHYFSLTCISQQTRTENLQL